ncbi:MAG: N-acetylmuramoyl-L-alanine amidase [Aerococcaceae bacterium]|nr:N-acetylmuramoyl-L-alanine amidase [Aerococcaceae bacterium]
MNFSVFLRTIGSRKYFPPIATLLLIALSVMSLSLLFSSETLTLQKEEVTLRVAPATNSVALQTLKKNQSVQIIKEENGWYFVRLDGKTEGWIPIWLLESKTLHSEQDLYAQILVETSVYQSENESSPVIGTLQVGDTLPIIAESGGWSKITFNHQPGFVRTRLIQLVNKDAIRTQSPSAAQNDTQQLQVRLSNQAFLKEANADADILYTINFNQLFKLIDTVQVDDVEYYLAEDERGVRGYLDSRITAKLSDSATHMNTAKVASLDKAVIVLDAGHGGEDPGAINEDPYTQEDQIALSTTLALQTLLEAEGATVILTRADNSTVSLEERVDLSEAYGADAFISIHYDNAADVEWSGTTSYYYHEADYHLTNQVNMELAKLSMHNNGVRFGNFQVLRENDQPSILLELGYMSNANDVAVIRTEEYQQTVAKAIVAGLKNYFNQPQ